MNNGFINKAALLMYSGAVRRWTEVKIDERRNAGSLRCNRERYVPH